jgi:hypothetical protein
VNGVALPAMPTAGPGTGTGTGTGAIISPLSGGDNANGDHELNDRCFGSTAAAVSPLAALLGLLAFAARRRPRL